MTKLAQHRNWSWPIRVGVATGVLALVVFLGRVVVTTPSAEAHADATFTVLYSFKGGSDGANPHAGLIRDQAGNLYGTTVDGGAANSGTVFKLDATGTETVLHSFTGAPDGVNPYAGLIRDTAGNLYGTTSAGGAAGHGTVFKLDTTGVETVLHSFTAVPDGAAPYAGLVRDAAGNLYGTTTSGGAGYGTVFKLDPTGTETVLHSFDGRGDGGILYAGVIRDTAGNLYGTTLYGGPSGGRGTVFKVDATGAETVLYTFKGVPDGQNPVAGLIRDTAGNLYGITLSGGFSFGYGTVFKLDATGAETVLYRFGPPPNGRNPGAGLVRDAAGNLYGTTFAGGTSDFGTVFKLDKTGKWTILHNFAGPPLDGQTPSAGLVRDAAGNLYGTTFVGGTFNQGTVFKLSR